MLFDIRLALSIKLSMRSEDILRIGRLCPLLRHFRSYPGRGEDYRVCYIIDDQDIGNFAKSIPHLRTLVLGEDGDFPLCTVITSQALNALGTYCPNLEQVCLPIDFHDVLEGIGTDSPLFPSLKHLDIYALHGFTEPDRIETLLSYHFPALEALYCPYRIGPLRPPFTVDQIRGWLTMG